MVHALLVNYRIIWCRMRKQISMPMQRKLPMNFLPIKRILRLPKIINTTMSAVKGKSVQQFASNMR